MVKRTKGCERHQSQEQDGWRLVGSDRDLERLRDTQAQRANSPCFIWLGIDGVGTEGQAAVLSWLVEGLIPKPVTMRMRLSNRAA